MRAELANYQRFAALSEEIVEVNEAICEARPPDGPHGLAPSADDRGRRGLREQVEAEFAAEVARLTEVAVRCAGSSGEELGAVELADPHRDDAAGRSLLGRLLAADAGHRGQRIDCGRGAFGRVRCLPDQDDRHRAGPGRGAAAPTTTAPRAGAASFRVTTSSVSRGRRCRRGCAR